jgi:hypothetical protein
MVVGRGEWWRVALLRPLLHVGRAEDVVGRGDWLDMAVLSTHLVAALAWLTMLGLLTLLSWEILRSADARVLEAARAWRRRLLGPLWAAIGVLLITGVYNQFRNVPFPVPHPWNLGEITIPYGQVYTLLLLGKHLLVVQMTLGLAVVTWRLAGPGPRQTVTAPLPARTAVAAGVSGGRTWARNVPASWENVGTGRGGERRRRRGGGWTGQDFWAWWAAEEAGELGTALIGTLSLISGVLVLVATAALGYVHVLAHGHGG